MNHCSIDFDVEEISPSQWRSKICRKTEVGPTISGDPVYGNQAEPPLPALTKINSELGAANDA